jgi:DNA-binding GntR family transcriptional regulator
MAMRTADRIREALEQAIVEGEFTDGERLDEVRLAEQFSASRTPVREALQALSASGLAEQLPRRGVFVRHPSFVQLVEMFEVMAQLEAMSGALAARRVTDTDLRKLEVAMKSCERACASGDTDLYYRENEHFHQLIYAASANSFLASEAVRLQKRLAPFHRLQLRVRNRMRQSMKEHDAIVAAIRAGDSDEAARKLQAHVAIQGVKFNDLMASYENSADATRLRSFFPRQQPA